MKEGDSFKIHVQIEEEASQEHLGFRVIGKYDGSLDLLRDGLPVEAGFEDVDEKTSLLRFRIAQ